MSKARGNVVELRMSADETAKKLKGAKTDSDRQITYDPSARPEVANLLELAALCEGGDPAAIAESLYVNQSTQTLVDADGLVVSTDGATVAVLALGGITFSIVRRSMQPEPSPLPPSVDVTPQP